jgi:UDP-GlcNAc:undecaprenyl-phosphate/decaprenyl-phosphate GlcNAc-1-phosphate transferase
MKQILLEAGITAAASLVLALMIIPLIIKFSPMLGLVDKPNHRKVHIKPIPVAGGISIVIATSLALILSKSSLQIISQYPVLLSGGLLLFIVGVWDDRNNLPPSYRLLVQVICAAAVAASGIRLTSLYGMFGMNEINIYWQYILTVMIIVGVTNAFNLMDGIDGLAGGLAFINLLILAGLAFVLKQYAIFLLLIVISAAIIAFLKNNISPARIFMGDGGSLLLGFLMSSIGILLIETTKTVNTINVNYVVLTVSAILVVPVFDSLRVYVWRMQRGESPFKADKTHLHHLFLIFGLNHKKAAFFIYALEIVILATGLLLQKYAGISLGILILIVVFISVTQLLQLNYGVDKWTKVIRKMENGS